MRTLIYACSAYQLFNAINIRMNLLKDDIVDILLSDKLKGQERLAENLKKTGLFDNIFTSKSNFIAHQEYKHTRFSVYAYRLFPDIILKQAGLVLTKKYDRFLIATVDDFIGFVYLKLCQKNKKVEVCIYEDGGITYIKNHQSVNGVEKNLYKWLRIKSINMLPLDVLLYEPNLLMINYGGKVYTLPKIKFSDTGLKEKINIVFDFDTAPDVDTKYLFFEESFLAAGIKNNDEKLINLCFDLSNKQMKIKNHPGNPYNRFENTEIKSFSSNIPWEIFCLNVDLSDKVLITVNSNAAISPHIIFEKAPKTVLLFNLLIGESFLKGTVESEKYYSKILELFPNDIIAPKSIDELKEILMV